MERELGADPSRAAGAAPPAWRRLWASARQRPLATAAVAVLTLCLIPVGIVAAGPNDLLVSGAVTIAAGVLAARVGWERPGLIGFTLVYWGAFSFFAAAWGNWEDISRVELAAFLLWSAGLPLAAGFLFVSDQLTARVPDPESNAVLFRLATAGLVSFASVGGLFGWVADGSALLLWSLLALLVSPLTYLMFVRTSSAISEPGGAVVAAATPARRAPRRVVYGAALGVALLIVLGTAALAQAWVGAEKRYTLDVVVSGNGVVRLDGFPCEDACDEHPYAGTRVTLEAEPGTDSDFKRWLGACAPTGDTRECVVTMDADKETTAVFGPPDVVRVPGTAARAPVHPLYRVSGKLPAGVHATRNFLLPVRFTLGPGWRSLYDSRDIVLYKQRDPGGRYLVFSAQFAAASIPEAVGYVESRKGLVVVASRRLRIGAHDATELQLEVLGSPATLYSYEGDFGRTKYSVATDDALRLVFVDFGAGTLTIVVESPAAGSAAFVRDAMRVARSVARA